MRMIFNDIIPFKGFSVINLFGVLFVRKRVVLNDVLINHEKIHTKQMQELGYVFFYLFYLVEWIIKLFRYGKHSYYNISFEREAYQNDTNLDYLYTRKRFGFLTFL